MKHLPLVSLLVNLAIATNERNSLFTMLTSQIKTFRQQRASAEIIDCQDLSSTVLES